MSTLKKQKIKILKGEFYDCKNINCGYYANNNLDSTR